MLMNYYNNFGLLRLFYENEDDHNMQEGDSEHQEIKNAPLQMIRADVDMDTEKIWVPIRQP